jgi:uncharacterized protein YdhG (YjbR/CyaY superfamily)
MAEKKTTKKTTRKADGWTDAERAAMKAHTEELKAAKRGAKKADEEATVLAKIAEMPEPDRTLAERIHAIVKETAPEIGSRTWYGMPAYTKDGKVLCFFQAASKFDANFATFGFNDVANLEEGSMWPTGFAVKELTAADEKKIAALVKKAIGA